MPYFGNYFGLTAAVVDNAAIAAAVLVAMNAAPPVVNVTLWAGEAVAAADANGNVPVIVKAWYDTLVPEPDTAGYPDVGTVSNISLHVSQQVRDAMKLAPSGGATAVGSVDAQLAAVADAVWATALPGAYGAGTAGKLLSDLPSAGAGAIAHTITVDDGTNPLDGAEVWISTDEAGSNVVAGTLSTDALGRVTFMLDAGTYWKHVQLAGYNFTAKAFTVA